MKTVHGLHPDIWPKNLLMDMEAVLRYLVAKEAQNQIRRSFCILLTLVFVISCLSLVISCLKEVSNGVVYPVTKEIITKYK